MPDVRTRRTRATAVLAVVLALLGGCATTTAPYTPALIQTWGQVDLAVDMVEPSYQATPVGAVPVIVGPSPAALAVGIIAGQLLQAGSAASVEAANDLTERLRLQLLDIDLAATMQAEVMAHAPPALKARLRSTSKLLPEPDQGPQYDKALAEMARKKSGDGLLAVRVWPMPRSKYVVPGMLVQVRLLNRQGDLLRSADLWTLSGNLPSMEPAARSAWWEAGRWRRFVRLALQSSAMAMTWRLEPDADAGASEARFVEMKAAQASLELESSRLRTTLCALEAEEARPMVHRFERRWLEVRTATVCADEPAAQVPEGSSSLMSRAVPALPLRMTAQPQRPPQTQTQTQTQMQSQPINPNAAGPAR